MFRKPIPGTEAKSNEITIVHFNDVYEVSGIFSDGKRRGGLGHAAHIIEKARARNPNRTFVTFGGDAISPSTLSSLFNGEQMIDMFNKMGINMAVLGNHEFDYGEQQ